MTLIGRAEAEQARKAQLAWSLKDGKSRAEAEQDARGAYAWTMDEWFPAGGDLVFWASTDTD